MNSILFKSLFALLWSRLLSRAFES